MSSPLLEALLELRRLGPQLVVEGLHIVLERVDVGNDRLEGLNFFPSPAANTFLKIPIGGHYAPTRPLAP